MDFKSYMEQKRALIDLALDELLPPAGALPARIHESMRYSVFAGGKRLRPILCIAALETLGKDPVPALPAACALELLHAYSLIHDDLPCMDDDEFRRGKPTNHRVYGEAVALLAGDALLSKAFELVAAAEGLEPGTRVELVEMLAVCAGTEGLVGGQVVDLESEGKKVAAEVLEYIHSRKTAALIRTSVLFGAVMGAARERERESLGRYGRALGMAFQITDDILDVTGDDVAMGKRAGQDARAGKATYPALHGLEKSRATAEAFIREARDALGCFGETADPLREIARFVARRNK